MALFDTLKTIPVGAVLTLPEEQRLPTLEKLNNSPASIRNLASAERTGAYVRGLARTYNLSLEQSWNIALTLLYLCLGEIPRQELVPHLSQQAGIPTDTAQKIVQDIDRELLTSVNLDLNRLLAQKQGNTPSPQPSPTPTRSDLTPKPTPSPTKPSPPAPPRNVLNLKQLPQNRPTAQAPRPPLVSSRPR